MRDVWLNIQKESYNILGSGLNSFISEKKTIEYPLEGNYLFHHGDVPLYIGESLDVEKRLKQHRQKNSSLYKNIQKYMDAESNVEVEVKILNTQFGRKEIEEKGMFRFQPLYNRFHKNRVFNKTSGISNIPWKEVQERSQELLKSGEENFFRAESNHWSSKDISYEPGIYRIVRGNEIIYIGESISLKRRIMTHDKTTRFSVLRRAIATQELGLTLKTKLELGNTKSKDKKRSFLSPEEEVKIDEYLSECKVAFLPVLIGRLELEEFLIFNEKPKFNKRSR